MEKEKRMKSTVLFLLMAIVVLLGCLAVLGVLMGNYHGEQKKQASAYRTFADWTDREELKDVPALVVEGTRIEEAYDYGDETYGTIVVGTSLSDYQEYLTILEKSGFKKVVDNGKDGLEKTIYTTSYTKEDLSLTVTQVVSTERTYIMACKNLEFSKNLFYDKSYVAGNEKGRKTKMHLLELWESGNSLVFELKNGHFVINDGGTTIEDLEHLLDYLEALVPKGEKPIIDAWIFSHTHSDHIGAFNEFANHPEYASRVIVDGIYWNVPNYEVYTAYDAYAYTYIANAKVIANMLKTQEGTIPKIYRMQSGQRYYFNDFTVDVLHTQEQLIRANYYGNLNDASVWLMYNIDGDNFLLAGDSERGSTEVVMNTFDSAYFDLKVYTVFHHAINIWNDFTDYLTYDVALYPNYRAASKDGNDAGITAKFSKYINDKAKESIAWGKGTAVMTFPYELGTVEFQPALDWSKYATGERTGTKIWVDEFEVHLKNF